MNTYRYKTRDKLGKSTHGLMDAESESAVAARLKEMGYLPVSIRPAQGSGRFGAILKIFKKASAADVFMFTRQFSALQKAGIPILLSLRALSQEMANARLKSAVLELARDIEAGASLSAALSKHGALFNPMYINLIKTGEASGKLGDALERLAELGEYEEKIRQRIQAATRYPLIVVAAIIAGFLALTTIVVPRFAAMYSQFSVALPLPTRILFWLNHVVSRYWWQLIVCAGGGWYALWQIGRTKKGRLFRDSCVLKVPVFGPLVLKLIMSRFTRITGSLIQAGVGLFDVLTLASGGVGNVVVSRSIEDIKKSVSEGKGVSEPMKHCGMFTAVVVQMVAVGEQTGQLDKLLLRVSDYYDSQVKFTVDNLTSLIEPFLILLLGCAVLFMALGIFLPMWNLMSLFRH